MYFSFCLSCTFLFALMQKEKIPKEKDQGCLSGATPADFRPEGQKTRCAQTNCPSLRSEADLRLTPRRGGRGLRGDYTGVGALGFTGSARRQGRGLRGDYACAGAVGFTGSARRVGRGLRGGYTCAGRWGSQAQHDGEAGGCAVVTLVWGRWGSRVQRALPGGVSAQRKFLIPAAGVGSFGLAVAGEVAVVYVVFLHAGVLKA